MDDHPFLFFWRWLWLKDWLEIFIKIIGDLVVEVAAAAHDGQDVCLSLSVLVRKGGYEAKDFLPDHEPKLRW